MAQSVLASDSFDDSCREIGESEDLFSSTGNDESDDGDILPSQINSITAFVPRSSAIRGPSRRRLFSESPPNVSNFNVSHTTKQLKPSANCTGSGNVEANINTQTLILEEVRRANSRLDIFAEQLTSLEKRLTSVETGGVVTPSSSGTSTDCSGKRGKRKVPAKVSHCVRDVYKTLCEGEDFFGYDTKKLFSDPFNQEIVKRLIVEVTSLESTIPPFQIRDAARRFFLTKSDEVSLKERGIYGIKVQRTRRRNRISRKLKSRMAVFLKTGALTDATRDSFKSIMTKDFMSSEESGEDNNGAGDAIEKTQVLYIRPLTWRAPKLNRFFKSLDHKAEKKRTRQGKQQTLPRLIGAPSRRPKPIGFNEDFFGFNSEM